MGDGFKKELDRQDIQSAERRAHAKVWRRAGNRSSGIEFTRGKRIKRGARSEGLGNRTKNVSLTL